MHIMNIYVIALRHVYNKFLKLINDPSLHPYPYLIVTTAFLQTLTHRTTPQPTDYKTAIFNKALQLQ